MSVSSSSGSPTVSAFVPATKASTNSSYTSVWTMNRSAAMHDWPLFIVRAVTAVRTAARTSAEGSTMHGSDPPSSRTAFFTSEPATAAIDRPAGSDPV